MSKNSNGKKFDDYWPLLTFGDQLFFGAAMIMFALLSWAGKSIEEVAVDKRSWPRLLLVLGVFSYLGIIIYGSGLLIEAGYPADWVVGGAVALASLAVAVIVAALFRMVYERGRKDKDDHNDKE
jgi:hypothetical protein